MAVTLAEVGAVPSVLAAGRAGDGLAGAGVCEVRLFGSVARGEFAEDSDIDDSDILNRGSTEIRLPPSLLRRRHKVQLRRRPMRIAPAGTEDRN